MKLSHFFKRGLNEKVTSRHGLTTLTMLIFTHLFLATGQAQVVSDITPDGSLGTTVTQAGNVFNIQDGTIVGTNQFHSLSTFSVGMNDIASFNGPGGILNILSRVTGGQQSLIDGTIRSTIPGANLFLVNFAGLTFSEHAVLDIGSSVGQPGSFYASTANVMRLSDGLGQFFSSLGEPDVLTTAAVAQFGFLTDNPETIRVEGSGLAVGIDTTDPLNPKGKTLGLIGGDITVTGDPNFVNFSQLSAPSGTIKLASLSGPGTVVVSEKSPAFQINAAENHGSMTITDSAVVTASGDFVEGDGIGGTVYIRGGQLIVENFAQVVSDTQYGVDGAQTGVDIDVSGDVIVRNTGFIFTDAFDAGRSGDMNIKAWNVTVTDGSSVFTSGSGSGTPGDISIWTAEALTVSGDDGFGNFSQIQSLAFGPGDTGAISFEGRNATISNRGRVETDAQSSGNSGSVTMVASQDINVNGGAYVRSIATGAGTSGSVTLTADERITITGQFDEATPTYIHSENNNPGEPGENGDITISGKNVVISDNAEVFAFNDLAQIGGGVNISATDTITVANGGKVRRSGGPGINEGGIQISAPTINVDNGMILSRTFTDRDAGPTTFTGDTINFTGGSQVVNSTFRSSGNSGPISINATELVSISEGSTIQSASANIATGAGGPISIISGNLISISGTNSGVFSETSTSGNGGSITLQGANVQITDNATVSARSTSGNANAGNSGSVTITATGSFQSDNSTISTSAQQGAGGNITITAGQDVSLQNATTISAESLGTGNAGDITIGNANTETILVENSAIRTNAANADGGNIKLDSNFMIQVVNSTVSSSVAGGAGAGGNINFDPQWILIQNSQILANAFGGPGGNITLTADAGIFSDTLSIIDASSQFGTSGNVNISAPIQNLSGVISSLPEDSLKVARMYAERCAAQKGGQFSSFVQGGPDGVPPAPGGFMPSPLQFSVPHTQSHVPSGPRGSSATMVKRLGLEQSSDFGDMARFAYWAFGDALRGCRA